MNRIERNIYDINNIQVEIGIPVMKNYKEHLIESFEDKAYETSKIHLLVDCSNMSVDTINVGEMDWANEDYTILTSRGTYETPEGDYIEFTSEEDYDEYIEENEIEDAPDWCDFAQDSEIYWNTFWRFNDHIDLDAAKKLGLPAIELRNGDQYMSISGCGMDMSFQIMQYQTLAHARILEEYATESRLHWCKMNMSTEDFKKMLSDLGVNIDRVKKEYFEKK